MNKLIMYICVAIMTILFAGCSSDSTDGNVVNSGDDIVVNMLPTSEAITLNEQEEKTVANNNEFSFNFYRKMNDSQSQKADNISSPVGVAFVLGMLNAGDDGQVSKEIAQLLGFNIESRSATNSFFSQMISNAPKIDSSVTLKIANMVVANHRWGVEFDTQYISDIQTYYQGETMSLDFSTNDAEESINNWCNEHTDGMIPHIFHDGGEKLNPNSLLIALNAIVFKAPWTNKFDENVTEYENFDLESGARKLPMMHSRAYAQYSTNEDCQLLRLPFGNGDKWSMIVLLPNEGKTVDHVINSLSVESWKKSIPTRAALLDIKIPRFTTTTHLDLIHILSELGAPTMFSIAEGNNFNLMFKNYKKDLMVGKFFQDSSIEVSEEGTKASAVSEAEILFGSSIPLSKEIQIIDFHANRPFVYLIEESTSGSVFFIGTYRGME